MTKHQNPEDRKIRLILIGLVTSGIAGFLITVIGIAILIATNFNILQWME